MSNHFVYARNPNSGEVHRFVEDGKSRFVDERCGFDVLKEFDRFESEAEAVEFAGKGGGSWCLHCCWAEAEFADGGTDWEAVSFPGDAAETDVSP